MSYLLLLSLLSCGHTSAALRGSFDAEIRAIKDLLDDMAKASDTARTSKGRGLGATSSSDANNAILVDNLISDPQAVE